jgi:hypothetical protein
LFSSPIIIRVLIKEIEMSRACCTLGQMRNAHRIVVEKPERQDHLGVLGTDGSIILK